MFFIVVLFLTALSAGLIILGHRPMALLVFAVIVLLGWIRSRLRAAGK